MGRGFRVGRDAYLRRPCGMWIVGFSAWTGRGTRPYQVIDTKKDPRGIAPRVLKQTDDLLKILSYGDGGVWQ